MSFTVCPSDKGVSMNVPMSIKKSVAKITANSGAKQSRNSVTKLVSSFLHIVLIGALACEVSACGSKSTIDLQKPAAPADPVAPPNQKPSTGTPSKPNEPGTNPDQPGQDGHQAPRYRLVCEGVPQVKTPFVILETTSRSFDGSFGLMLGSYDDPNKVITRENWNIAKGSQPIVIPGAAPAQIDYLFIGQKQIAKGQIGDLRLFDVNVDTVYLTGRAVDLGPVLGLKKSTRLAAEGLNLSPSNYGSSDAGTYVLIPTTAGFKVLTRDRSRTLGTIKADSTQTILPKIFEGQKVFTALQFNGRTFNPVVQKLAISASSVSVSPGLNTGLNTVLNTVLNTGSTTATPLQIYKAGQLVWSETTSSAPGSIIIATLQTSTGQVTRASYRTPVEGAKIFPQIAVTNDEGSSGPVVNVAVESFIFKPTDENPGASVSYAKVQKLIVSVSGTSLVEGDAVDYPGAAIARVTTAGLIGKWIIGTLFTTERADELLGTFDSRGGYQAFRDRGGFFDGVGQNTCVHPAVTEVKQ